jgi:hypothetical protein
MYKRGQMLYRWNQIDPGSAAVLIGLVVMLCTSLASIYLWPSHPFAALATGVCIGVLVGQAIPPRLSLRRLALNVLVLLGLASLLAVFHLL